ncbi:MAG TPA: DUF1549 domain-containing protein [Planctomycetota bacterium]|nr:DUF1549 domain-containing protein [Planctomycetota bacterium]
MKKASAWALLVLVAVAGPARPEIGDERLNFVDWHLRNLWRPAGVAPADPSSDGEFLRRVTLDLAGRIPGLDELAAFEKDSPAGKRDRVIDRLLASEEFNLFWGERLASVMLGYPGYQVGYFKDSLRIHLQQKLREGRGYDRIVHEILTSSSAPAGYGVNQGSASAFAYTYIYQVQNPNRIDDLLDRVSKVFLGVSLHCAQCHDHPFDRWTQQDYKGMRAFLKDLGRGAARRLPNPPAPAPSDDPIYLDGSQPEAGAPLMTRFADLTTRPENPRFARNFVNRVWAMLFGRGIIHPVEELKEESKPAVAGLLEILSAQFVRRGHDLRWLLRTLTSSKTYQLSSQAPAGRPSPDAPFAQAPVRAMTPEQLFGAISAATDLRDAAAKAQFRPDPLRDAVRGVRGQGFDYIRSLFIADIVATGDYETASRASEYTANMMQFLRMADIDHPVYAGSRAGTGGRLDKIAARASMPSDWVALIYRSVLSRDPTPEENRRCLQHVVTQPDLKGYGDVFWALLNSSEFFFQH